MQINCDTCGRECTLGIDAVYTLDGRRKCDDCAGIVRGLGGFAHDKDPQPETETQQPVLQNSGAK